MSSQVVDPGCTKGDDANGAEGADAREAAARTRAEAATDGDAAVTTAGTRAIDSDALANAKMKAIDSDALANAKMRAEEASRPTANSLKIVSQNDPVNWMLSRPCEGCGVLPNGTTTMFACSACRAVVYCDTSCQKVDWKSHKVQCKAYVAAVSEAAARGNPAALAEESINYLIKPGEGNEARGFASLLRAAEADNTL